MDNGNTAIQVSPITEDDMRQVQTILQRAVDGIVGMSQLHADVDMLRQTVQGLQADVERMRNQNATLDEALTNTRRERDLTYMANTELARKLNEAEQLRDSFSGANDDLRVKVDGLQAELRTAKQDRDDHGMRTLELEEANKTLQAKLDKLAEAHKAVFGQEATPTPPPAEATPKNTWDRYLPGGSYNPDYLPD